MLKKKAGLLFGVCFALAACTDSATNGSITAPVGSSALDVSATAAASTPYDWAQFAAGAGVNAEEPLGAAQASTGGRASGHFVLSTPTGNRASEEYSFIALSTNPAPTAKGQVELHTVFVGGLEAEVHIDVDCLAVVGNQAWFSGPAKRFVLGGVPQPPGLYLVFRVEDNGEGANDPPDRGSTPFAAAPMACSLMPLFPLVPTARGNIQVSQK